MQKDKKTGRPQLHASALESKCLEAFRRRYIEGEIIPPDVAMIVGTGTHKSVEANLGSKIKNGVFLPIGSVADAARDGVNQAWEGGVRLAEEDACRSIKIVKGEAVDKAVRLSVIHAAEKAPKLNPTHIERPWSIELPGCPLDLVGRIDIQEAPVAIRDTKTSGKTPGADCAVRSMALKAYALAAKVLDGMAPARVWLDYLIDLKTPKVESYEHQPNEDDFRALLCRVEILVQAIENGIFPPVEPGHWCCDPKWCGYHSSCRYVRSKQFAAA